MHGATAICVTRDDRVVLVRADGGKWSLPGGRPDPGESWEETLHREMREEACAVVTGATLLGYGRGQCLRGHEAGLVLVRSLWRAEVNLLPWEPEFEMADRREFPVAEAIDLVRDALPGGHKRIITRLFVEAGLA
jgi:ADP-ribose pyrophosphatase YjhB (NUDIX family)